MNILDIFYYNEFVQKILLLYSKSIFTNNAKKQFHTICQDSSLDISVRMFDVILENLSFGTRPQGSVAMCEIKHGFIKTTDNQVDFFTGYYVHC